jgi:hypothetical protein
MKELNNARESKQDCLREWFQTAGRGGRYDRLQGPIQQAAEADTASRSFNISSNVKFQMFNFKSECQMKRTMTIRESVFSHHSRLYRQILFASPPTLRA